MSGWVAARPKKSTSMRSTKLEPDNFRNENPWHPHSFWMTKSSTTTIKNHSDIPSSSFHGIMLFPCVPIIPFCLTFFSHLENLTIKIFHGFSHGIFQGSHGFPMGKTQRHLGAEDHPRVAAVPGAQHHPGVADEGDVHLARTKNGEEWWRMVKNGEEWWI